MIHAVKIRKEYFEEIKEGRKTWEVRFNDRGYSIGDYIALNEFDGKEYTGRCILAHINNVGDYNDYVKAGFVVLNLTDIRDLTNVDRYAHYMGVPARLTD